MPTICYYISGHGLGHAARSMHVIEALPNDWRVLIRTDAQESFFREQLVGRPFTYLPARFDCGCVQRDSLTVLPRETLALYREIEAENGARLDEEIAFLHREHVDCVISDIAPFPLRAARAAGVPALAVSNFSWCDIYKPFVESAEDASLLDRMADEYGAADAAFVLPFSLPSMRELFRNSTDIPLVAQRGIDIGPRIKRWLSTHDAGAGLDGCRLALIYLGVWGIDFDWRHLEEQRDWTFLTYEAPPAPVPNVRHLDRAEWVFEDVCASVDLVVSKTGYGLVAACIANQTPLVYVRREDFAEHPILAAALADAGLGIEIPVADFLRADWGSALDRASDLPMDMRDIDISGANAIADGIAAILAARR